MKTTVAVLLPALAGAVVTLHGALVQAAGFQIQEQSVRGLGNAFAGGAASAEDASTVIYNPAGLTRVPRQAEFAGHIIVPQADFHDRSSTNAIGGRPLGRTDDGGATALVPNFFYANPINERLSFGFGVTSLYGLVTEYDRGWIGRYHAVKSELLTVNFNPALAYRVNDWVSLGGGFSVQYADAELTNAIDFGTLGFLAGAPVSPSTPAFDGFSTVTGDDIGYGFNIGVLFEPSRATRIGLSYRSEIDLTLEGDNKLRVPDFATALAGPSRTRGARAEATTPASASLSVFHEIDSRWSVMADVTWTDWSSFEELRIEFDDDPVDPDPSDSVQPENWDDSYRYSIGVDYRYNDALTLRGGLAYDETPVDDEFRTPRIPDGSRRWLTLGATYRMSDSLSFDFGYAHIFVGDIPIDDTEVTTGSLAGVPVGNTLDGEYDGEVDIVSAQLQWRF